VLHREADPATRFDLGREVAALIPGATLVPLPGTSHLFYHGEWAAVLDATLAFPGEPGHGGPRLTRRKLKVRSRAQIAAWVTEYRLSHPGPG
jgi:hypothetical protein